MPRLRVVPVEFKKCICDKIYEAEQCPYCGKVFDPTASKVFSDDWLIVVGTDSPIYEPVLRLRCPKCRNLYKLPDGWTWDMVQAARTMLRNTQKLREEIERGLEVIHCPLCGSTKIPQRPVTVWVRATNAYGAESKEMIDDAGEGC